MKSPPPSPEEDAPISAETLLAVRRYNQEVASYTLRQWNVAKLESEKKERDRRRRRAEVLAQRQHTGAGGAGTGTGHSSSNGAGSAYGNQIGSATNATNTRQSGLTMSAPGTRPLDAHRTKSDGPLMMVSRRRSDRDRGGGMSGSTSSGPAHAQSGYRPLHDHQRHDYAKRAHSIHNDIEHLHQVTQMQTQQAQDVGALQSTSVKRIEKQQRASAQADDPDDDFAKPVTNHIESATVEMTLAFDDANPYIPVEEEDEPLPPPDPIWHHRRSDSTPPIPIPRPPSSVVSHRSDIGSSGSSALSTKSSSPARALGFAAHLGMTSISGAPSAALTGSVSASASVSNPVSEGSSRMSSFSEHNEGFRHGVPKKLTGEGAALAAAAANAALRPRRHHRSSLASVEPMVAERLDVSGPHIVEGAIGHLRRMTVSGGERAIFELDQH